MTKGRGSVGDDILLVLIMAAWGLNFILTKIALRDIDMLALTFVRNAATLFALAAAFLLIRRRLPVVPGNLGRLAIVGLVGIALNQIFYNAALRYTSASNAALLSSTAPIFGLMLARLLENERTSLRRWLGVVVGLMGVSMIVGGGSLGFSLAGEGIVGDLFMLAAAACFALFALLGRPLMKVCSPLEVTLLGYAIGVPALLPVSAGAMIAQSWSTVAPIAMVAGIGAGINTAISNALFYRQIDRVGAPRAMVFLYLTPISGVLLAMLLLQETLTWVQAVGAVVALAGVNWAREG